MIHRKRIRNSLTITISIIYFVLVVIILPVFCRKKALSPLNNMTDEENNELERYKNAIRKREAKEYLKKFSVESSHLYYRQKLQNKKNVDHLVIIIANKPKGYTSDNNSDYSLSQLVTEIDKNIRVEEKFATAMMICNRTKENFIEIETLSKFYPIFEDSLKSNRELYSKEEKLKVDFANCVYLGLKELQLHPRYVTVLRDSVVPYSNFLSILHDILRLKVENTPYHGDLLPTKNPWMFLHLQEPVPFRSFRLDLASFQELCFVAILGYCLFSFCEKLLAPFDQYSRWHCVHSILLRSYGILLFLTFAVLIGRPYLTESRRSFTSLYRIYEPTEAVHISAVTLPFESALFMADYLSKIYCSVYAPFKDVWYHSTFTMDKPGYVVSPSLVRYVVNA